MVYVDPDAPGTPNDGTTWNRAFLTLPQGLADAALKAFLNPNAVIEVWVAEGTYRPGTSQGSSFSVSERIQVYGAFLGWPTNEASVAGRQGSQANTILTGDVDNDSSPLPDPDDAWHVVSMSGEQTRLDGFTITNGYADGPSGNGVFDDSGAGVLLSGGSSPRSIIANCTVQLCVCFGRGAGLFARNTGGVRVRHCTFVSNVSVGDGITSGLGGAIAFDNIAAGFASLTGVGSCVFARNRAGRGGAISLENIYSLLAIYNCRIHDNVAQWVGGGIHVGNNPADPQPGYVEIFHSTMAFNRTLGGDGVPIFPSGSALYIEDNGAPPDLPIYMTSMIIWDNFLLEDSDQSIAGTSTALVVRYSDLQDTFPPPPASWTNNIAQVPLFVNGPLRDLHLAAGSPCIDAGSDRPLTPLTTIFTPVPGFQVGDLADINDNNVVLELVPWELAATVARELDDPAATNTGLEIAPPIGISDMGCYERQ